MRWKPVVLSAGVLAGAGLAGAWRWSRTNAVWVETLQRSIRPVPERVQFESFRAFPEPVAHYFRFALREGQRTVSWARFRQTGSFRIDLSREAWVPLRATQYFVTRPAGFLWDARIDMMPLLPVRVRDRYWHGGGMQASVLGAVPIVNEVDQPALHEGALQRYLGESVWLPTALLPCFGVVWTPVDGRTARATLREGSTTAVLDFHFGADGRVVSVHAASRGREVNGHYVPTPWTVTLGEYIEREGMRIPSEAEVAWDLPEGPAAYCRVRVEGVEYGWGEL